MICQVCKKSIENLETKKYFTDYLTRRAIEVMSCPECYSKAKQENLYLTEQFELVQEQDIDYDEIPALD